MPIGDIELKELREDMGFSPALLKLIYESHPKMFDIIYQMDKTLLSDGAISAKTKRLIALAVVSTMGCEACATAQMRAAMNLGASREEVLDTLGVLVVTAGMPAVAAARDALRKCCELPEEDWGGE
ncbi:MAG TPA: carboxymuconolactone decarboxylase family protein [Candidatus Bathyarchaeia archaeon]|nr:carboxymuconolactone decarboxylase family protein [Candidatus Bathyarchaeia archaeon]